MSLAQMSCPTRRGIVSFPGPATWRGDTRTPDQVMLPRPFLPVEAAPREEVNLPEEAGMASPEGAAWQDPAGSRRTLPTPATCTPVGESQGVTHDQVNTLHNSYMISPVYSDRNPGICVEWLGRVWDN